MLAQKKLISTLLKNPQLWVDVVDKIQPEWLLDEKKKPPIRKLYLAIVELARTTPEPDLIAVSNATGYSTDYLGKFLELETSPDAVSDYIEAIVKENYLEALTKLGGQLTGITQNAEGYTLSDIQEITDRATAMLREHWQTAAPTNIAEVVGKYLEYVAKQKDIPESERIVPTPLRALNDYFGGGLFASKLYMIGGRPGMGKTILLNTIREEFLSRGLAGASAVLEMGKRHTIERAIARHLDLPVRDVIRLKFLKDDAIRTGAFYKLLDSISKNWRWTLFGEECTRYSVLRAKIIHFLETVPDAKFVDIDFIQLVHATGYGERHSQLSYILQDLAAICHDSNAVFLVTSQLDRNIDSRMDPRPGLNDFKGYALEEHIDVGLGLYRPKFYEKSAGDEAELIFVKNRLGELGTVKVRFIGHEMRFVDL